MLRYQIGTKLYTLEIISQGFWQYLTINAASEIRKDFQVKRVADIRHLFYLSAKGLDETLRSLSKEELYPFDRIRQSSVQKIMRRDFQ